jgi:hypothetical protein
MTLNPDSSSQLTGVERLQAIARLSNVNTPETSNKVSPVSLKSVYQLLSQIPPDSPDSIQSHQNTTADYEARRLELLTSLSDGTPEQWAYRQYHEWECQQNRSPMSLTKYKRLINDIKTKK